MYKTLTTPVFVVRIHFWSLWGAVHLISIGQLVVHIQYSNSRQRPKSACYSLVPMQSSRLHKNVNLTAIQRNKKWNLSKKSCQFQSLCQELLRAIRCSLFLRSSQILLNSVLSDSIADPYLAYKWSRFYYMVLEYDRRVIVCYSVCVQVLTIV